MERFTDKVVLITGGGSGLGRAVALQTASEGAKLALVDISADGLEATKKAVIEATPAAQIITVIANVVSEDEVKAYVRATTDAYGRIDAFFNNAGIEGKQNLTEIYGFDEFNRVLGINLQGVFLGIKYVVEVMHAQGAGSIVNTASVGGIRGVGNQSGYAAAKHGVVGLTRNSAVEYGQFGIRINAIAPGGTYTPMVEASLRQMNPDDPEAAGREVTQANPMRRLGRAEEVAHLAAFLLSDDAGFINAAIVPIDGGQSAQY